MTLLLLLYVAGVQLSKWPGRLLYPGEEDAAEGTQLSEMVHLRQGVKIYRQPAGGEFDGAIYGPLCYLVGATVINPDKATYLPLRLLSLAATLGVIVAGAVFVFSLSHKKIGAAVTAALLASSAFIARYGISARADMLALLLAFSGFLLVYYNRESNRAVMFAAGLMLLSFFYKQQFVGAPTAVLAYFALERRFRQAYIFTLTMLVGGAALVLAFSFLIFPQQAFLLHFISYNHLPFDKSRLLPEILMFAIPLFVPLLGSADFADQQPDRLVRCYALASVGVYFALLSSSGSGADTNRVLEPTVVLSCLLAARIATSKTLIPGLAWAGALAGTLYVVAVLHGAFVVPQVRSADFAADSALQAYLRSNFRPRTSALSYYAGDPLRAGLDVPITNLWAYSALVRKGAISDSDVVSRIDRQGYGVILLDFDLSHSNSSAGDFYTTEPMRKAVLSNYQLQARLTLPGTEFNRYSDGSMYVWVPRANIDSGRVTPK